MSPGKTLPDDERIAWLRLARTPNVGPVTFSQLIQRFGTAAAALDALPDLSARRAKGRPLKAADLDSVLREMDAVRALGARLVASCEPDYPALLRHLDPPPPVLTCLGRSDLAHGQTVALVGARNASAAGRKIAREMAHELGHAGYAVASGMALGIDGEAHAGALKTGTIAVLGGGIDHVYPPQHDALYHQISENGLIVSENAFGHRAKAQDFPRRNRIITGLSRGVVVVEAAERSGSLISARVAGEQGREVMAVPGSPLDARAAGTNRLIRQGALLVRHANDVLDALDMLPSLQGAPPARLFESPPEDEIPDSVLDSIRDALVPHPMPLDEIARSANVSAAVCAAVLMELELSGEAITLPGGLAARKV